MSIITESTQPTLSQLPETYAIAVNHFSAIALSGEDQTSYLQGQVTCDVNQLAQHKLLIGAHCDAKGKMHSVFRLLSHQQQYLLLQPKTTIESSLQALQKFGVFAKVDIKELTDCQYLGLVGEQAHDMLMAQFDHAPDSMTPVIEEQGFTIAYIAGQSARYLIIGNEQEVERLAVQWQLPVFDHQVWQLLEIADGFPILHSSAVGEFVPQMMNVQAIHGISFNKGCYLGQETVARMQYLGKNKKALYLLSSQTDTLTEDTVIEKQLGENWRQAGTIQAFYQADNGETFMLAVLNNDVTCETSLRLTNDSQSAVSVLPLPYSLTST